MRKINQCKDKHYPINLIWIQLRLVLLRLKAFYRGKQQHDAKLSVCSLATHFSRDRVFRVHNARDGV
ncbi:hypothetical protein VZ94_20270 [Methylocucumis oryzae]|uniref:Uncharacterized protein n=1 Tax=Methylocucumis oryzae TaxID=1632867 RepID=A0A0F3IER0_9GAMM|nr:hypothetical protein VZ94_20270 [Methylocucumis oryzae]